ncbi:hypothetical protein [Aliiroseovarius subalbicans]|uniref:hypothetical protein n=1 Tax=Aliiroseovarius subalbicans TaxID=2925840 RepID=UPI001F5810B0|nr:hypothetical protein [Aliiroseovarius subalbicans]MCI2399533.1 hypothetical protein [Aliiroseovarius subalbicans]
MQLVSTALRGWARRKSDPAALNLQTTTMEDQIMLLAALSPRPVARLLPISALVVLTCLSAGVVFTSQTLWHPGEAMTPASEVTAPMQ